MIRLFDVPTTVFSSFLLAGGDTAQTKDAWTGGQVPSPLQWRLAATHDVQIDKMTGLISERKLKVRGVFNAIDQWRPSEIIARLGLVYTFYDTVRHGCLWDLKGAVDILFRIQNDIIAPCFFRCPGNKRASPAGYSGRAPTPQAAIVPGW